MRGCAIPIEIDLSVDAEDTQAEKKRSAFLLNCDHLTLLNQTVLIVTCGFHAARGVAHL